MGVCFTAILCRGQSTDLLVAAFSADAVLRYDGSSGALVGTFASHPSLDGAASITYGPDGNLYVLGEFSRNVLRFDGFTGAFIDTFISGVAMTAVGLTDPGFMEFGPDGNLYILHHITGETEAVWRFDASSGAFVDKFATGSGMAHTHGIAFGVGNFYLGNVGDNRIERYDPVTGAFLGTLGPDPDGGLAGLGSLAFGPDALLYATTVSIGGVRQINPDTGAVTTFIAGDGTVSSSTWGILFDGDKVYVGYIGIDAIRTFDASTGAFLGDFVAAGGVSSPYDMAFMPVPEPATVILLLAALPLIWLRKRAGD
ncbi:MAG: PEP-CTERM sorting domain-containing protein [Verrucomicrobiaceae bacterium]|nr:PEP-CTERM sorting domain-containing protein [Verrucomicrobiaceae bacterium]